MIVPSTTTTSYNAKPHSTCSGSARASFSKIGSELGTEAEISNFSMILYATPRPRARMLLPDHLETEDLMIDGRAMALVSVVSYLDLGSGRNGQVAFEQTSYRLHARCSGKSVHWLLGASIGSLSAIAIRQLWPMPCHLGAMEFQVMFGKNENRYLDYRLDTQSQWINASWEILDSGKPLRGSLCAPLHRTVNLESINEYFARHDGSIGSRQIRISNLDLTRGSLITARCDLLEKLGLLTAKEMARPILVALQHNLLCKFDAPQSESPSLPRSYAPINAQVYTPCLGH